MNKDLSPKIRNSKRVFKYVFGTMAVGALVIAPVSTYAMTQHQQKSANNLVKANFEKATSNASSQAVSGPTLLDKELAVTDFQFKGTNGEGTFTNNAAGLDHLDVFYSQNLADATSWTITQPTNLTNDDIFYARLAVKLGETAQYAIKPNVIAVPVSGLAKIVIPNPIDNIKDNQTYATLSEDFFTFAGLDGQGSVFLNNKGVASLSPVAGSNGPLSNQSPSLDTHLEVEYSKDGSTYASQISDLSNGQKIKAKIAVKPEYASLYELNNSPATQGLYDPIEIEVKNLWTSDQVTANAQAGQPLDPTKVVFSGDVTKGTVSYQGFNKDEYSNLAITRTSDFISGWWDNGLVLPNDNNLYTFDNVAYRFLPTTSPVNETYNAGDAYDANLYNQKIVTNEPLIYRNLTRVLTAQLRFNFLDGKDNLMASNLNLQDFAKNIPDDAVSSFNINLRFDLAGNLSSATKKLVNRDGSDKSGATDETLTPETFSFQGLTLLKIASSANSDTAVQNSAYIYIDKAGNIGTAMSIYNLDGTNGFALTSSIQSIFYNTGTLAWSKTRLNNLMNGEYVSVSTGQTPNDDSKNISVKASGLNATRQVIADLSDFKFTNDKKGALSILGGSSDIHRNRVNILYSLDGINFSDSMPKNLKNNDVVMIQQSLPDPTHPYFVLPPANAAIFKYTASGIDKTELSDALEQANFSFTGTQESGTIKAVDTSKLSNYVNIEYSDSETGTFSSTQPTNIKNGQTFYARLVIKPEDDINYTLKTGGTPVAISVSGLSALTLNDAIAGDDFVFTGTNESGTVALKSTKTLAEPIELQYALEGQPYGPAVPTTLQNGQKLFATLVIKSSEQANYNLANGWPKFVEMNVNGLSPKEISGTILPSDFIASGTAGSGTLTFNGNATSQLEVQYSKTKDSGYALDVPVDLKNDDKVYAKLAVKAASTSDYKLAEASAQPVEISISGLTKQVLAITQLTENEITYSGKVANGLFISVSKVIDANLDIVYGTSLNGTYSVTPPLYVKNGDKLFVKVGVKAASEANYELAGDNVPVELTLENLEKIPLTSTIDKSLFAIVKNDATGKVSLLEPAEAGGNAYYEYGLADAQGNVVWSPSAPTNIDDQKISIRLAPKDKANYEPSATLATIDYASQNDTGQNKMSSGYITAIVLGSFVVLILLIITLFEIDYRNKMKKAGLIKK